MTSHRGCWRLLALGLMLFGATENPAEASESCVASDAVAHAVVLYHGPGCWALWICQDGRFEAIAIEGKFQGLLSARDHESLRALVAALPRSRDSYEFGIHHIDAPALGLVVREGSEQYKYFVGDEVSGERENRVFAPVAELATFMRRLFVSPQALNPEEWFAPGRHDVQ